MSNNTVSSITIKGSLQTSQDEIPVHGLPIEISLRIKCYLGEYEDVIYKATTGIKGDFSFTCSHVQLKDSKVEKVSLKVFSPVKTENLFSQCPLINFDTITLLSKEQLQYLSNKKTELDLKQLNVKVLEYDDSEGANNYYQPKNSKHIPKPHKLEFYLNVIKGAFKGTVKSTYLKIENKSTDEVQKEFGKPDKPLEHTAQTLKEMIFTFYDPDDKDFKELEGYKRVLQLNFDQYEKESKDEEKNFTPPDLPNVEIVFKDIYDEKDNLEDLEIVAITLQYSKNEKAKTYYVNDKEEFTKAIKAACHVVLFLAEARMHLATCHLLPGTYTMAFLKHFIDSPIAGLLAPFMEGILRVNKLGEKVIFSKKEGVLGITSFKQQGINHILKDKRESVSYDDESPIPRFKKDTFGAVKELLYKTFWVGVAEFIKDKFEEIEKYKHEIYYAGLCLSKHSKNLKPFMKDKDTLDKEAINQLMKALTFFMYLIAHHYITHDAQRKWALDLGFASLAPHNDINEDNHKDSLYSGTLPEDAIKQLSIGYTLVELDQYLKNRTITTHPDMASQIVKSVKDNEKDFNKLGVDPNQIASTVMY